jgi:hypothetical protein
MDNLLANCAVDLLHTGATAGTSDVTDASSVDMAGYDGAMFIAQLGALSANQVTSLQIQGANADTGHADLVGAISANAADGDGDNLLIVDVVKPLQRYLKPMLNRATGNAVLDGIVCVRYKGSKVPVTQGASVASAVTAVSPIPA